MQVIHINRRAIREQEQRTTFSQALCRKWAARCREYVRKNIDPPEEGPMGRTGTTAFHVGRGKYTTKQT